jgi:hypothetical protein
MTELPGLKEIKIRVGESQERVGIVVTPASGDSNPVVTLVPKDGAQQERLWGIIADDTIRDGVEKQLAASEKLRSPLVAVGVPKQKV